MVNNKLNTIYKDRTKHLLFAIALLGGFFIKWDMNIYLQWVQGIH